MKLKYYPILWLLFLLASCRAPSPSFDPFDAVLEVDLDVLRKDSTLKLIGDCMAYAYVKDFGAYETYYAFYINADKGDSIVGKGLNIFLRRVIMEENIDPNLPTLDSVAVAQRDEMTDSIKRMPMDTVKVDSILGIFHLCTGQKFFYLIKG